MKPTGFLVVVGSLGDVQRRWRERWRFGVVGGGSGGRRWCLGVKRDTSMAMEGNEE